MNVRRLYGRFEREGKPDKIRAKLNNDRRIKNELDAEVRNYLEGLYDSEEINSDYPLKIKNRFYN